MKILKSLFPISFRFSDSVANLIIGILIYLVGGAIAGTVIGFFPAIPLISDILSLVSYLLGIYCTAGIVIEVLVFVKVLK